MPILELCERIQDAWVSRAISESTWGYPMIGAIHVLALALFGGAILVPHLRAETRRIRHIGLTVIIATGILLFASGAARYYNSTSFRIKIVLLVCIVLDALFGVVFSGQDRGKGRTAISLALWAAVIFASRGIAFF
jgi:hypothetical protein